MSITEFKELCESIQSLVIAVGVIIGGVWAIYRFLRLMEIDKAKSELLQIKQQIEERGTIKLDVSIEKLVDNNHFIVIANVKIVNIGNRVEVLDLADYDANVFKIDVNADAIGNAVKGKLTGVNLFVKNISISPNEEKNFPFIFKLNSGNHFFEFLVTGSIYETNRHLEAVKNLDIPFENQKAKWAVTKYFSVT